MGNSGKYWGCILSLTFFLTFFSKTVYIFFLVGFPVGATIKMRFFDVGRL